MAYVPPKDRVLEHSTSNSQTVFAITGAVDTSYNAFSAHMAVADTTYGAVVEPGVAFKAGLLTYSATNEVTVTTAYESKGTFSSGGTKEVMMGLPASRAPLPVPFNLVGGTIVESRAADATTYAVKTLGGIDPSPASPVWAQFGDGTQRAITAALSVTIPATAVVGVAAAASTPFRLWFALIDDAGTLRLGVRNCSDVNGVYGFPGHGVLTSTTIGAGADSAGVTYSNTGATAKQFVIIGFADYESGLADEGEWDAAPTRIQLFGPGMAKPGDELQLVYVSESSNDTSVATTFEASANARITITPSSVMSRILVRAQLDTYLATGGVPVFFQLSRGGAGNTNMIGNNGTLFSGGSLVDQVTLEALDSPYTAAAQLYAVQFKQSGGGSVEINNSSRTSVLTAKEIMG